jgi:hypothetical protein
MNVLYLREPVGGGAAKASFTVLILSGRGKMRQNSAEIQSTQQQ